MRLRYIFFTVIIAGQVFLYGSFWSRVDVATADFPAYYVAATLWKSGANPYHLKQQCQLESRIIKEGCIPYAHPPYLLPLIAAVSTSDYATSYWRWSTVLIVFALLSAIPLYFLKREAITTFQALLFFPLLMSIFMGNDTVVVLLSIALWVWLINDNKDFWSGLALSLGLVKPQLILLLAVPLLFSRRKAFAGFCVGGSVLTLLSFALVGPSGFRSIVELTLLTAKGEGFGFYQERMVNFTGILARNGINTVWAWPLFLIAIAGICILWRKRGITPASLSLAIVITVFACPHVHAYDLALLAIPLTFVHSLAPALGTLAMLSAFAMHREYVGAYVLLAALSAILSRQIIHNGRGLFRIKRTNTPSLSEMTAR